MNPKEERLRSFLPGTLVLVEDVIPMLDALRQSLADAQAAHEIALNERSDALIELRDAQATIAALHQRLSDVTRLVQQRLQPGGSPPPGDEVSLVDWITRTARQENEALKVRVAELEKGEYSHLSYIDLLETCNKQLEIALKFYANRENYDLNWAGNSKVQLDKGEVARTAIQPPAARLARYRKNNKQQITALRYCKFSQTD